MLVPIQRFVEYKLLSSLWGTHSSGLLIYMYPAAHHCVHRICLNSSNHTGSTVEIAYYHSLSPQDLSTHHVWFAQGILDIGQLVCVLQILHTEARRRDTTQEGRWAWANRYFGILFFTGQMVLIVRTIIGAWCHRHNCKAHSLNQSGSPLDGERVGKGYIKKTV